MRHLFTCCVLLALASSAVADDGDDESALPDFDGVRTPTSPGFTLLGLSPSEIERPSTPKAFAAAVGTALKDGSGAIEVAPYWMRSRPELTLEEFMGPGQLLRNISVSFAAVSTDATDMAPASTTLGIGVRTSASLTSDPVGECGDRLTQLAAAAKKELVTAHPEFATVMAMPSGPAQTEELIRLKREVTKGSVSPFATRCAVGGGLQARGWSMELALATSVVSVGDLAGGDPGEVDLGASAGWATFAHRWINASAVATVRARREVIGNQGDFLVESGARFIWARGRFAASAEALGRAQVARKAAVPERELAYRVAAVGEVRVGDETWLSVSFGQDYSDGDTGPLFTLANLKWDYGTPKVKLQ